MHSKLTLEKNFNLLMAASSREQPIPPALASHPCCHSSAQECHTPSVIVMKSLKSQVFSIRVPCKFGESGSETSSQCPQGKIGAEEKENKDPLLSYPSVMEQL